MQILDPGHIYVIKRQPPFRDICLTFVKRSGGAITYVKEWPGIQTQAVMRALIYYLELLQGGEVVTKVYPLWQLGSNDPQDLVLTSVQDVVDVAGVLIDRSEYLNSIIFCVETSDACVWLRNAQAYLTLEEDVLAEHLELAIYSIRMSLWCYEARAYRRKLEHVNRKQPTHDDTARPRAWRKYPCDDVPFNEEEIERRTIGEDGHIVLWSSELDAQEIEKIKESHNESQEHRKFFETHLNIKIGYKEST